MKTDAKSLAREKALKSIPYEEYSLSDKNFLKKQGIINGVGAEWQ